MVSIRRATLGDVPVYYKWFQDLKWIQSSDFTYMKGLTEYGETFVAEIQGEVVGVICWFQMTDDLSLMTAFVVKEDLRGQGIGRRLLETRPRYPSEKNVWLNAMAAAVGLYERSGFRVRSARTVHFLKGHPRVCPEVPISIPGVELLEGRMELFEQFIAYEKTIIAMSDALKGLMRSIADSGCIVLAKRSSKTVGAAIVRETSEPTKLRRLILFADCPKISLLLIRHAVKGLAADRLLLMTALEMNEASRKIAELFNLEIKPVACHMFTERDSLADCLKLDKVYSFIPY